MRNFSLRCLAVLVALTNFLPTYAQGDASITLLAQETNYGKRFDFFDNNWTLSPDKKRLAYWAKHPKGGVGMVVNGVLGKSYHTVGAPNPRAQVWVPGFPIWSPDSKHLAYRANSGADWFVVRDGKEGRRYKDPENSHDIIPDIIEDIIWSPNSRHLAYRVLRNKKWHVVLDNKEHRPYNWIAAEDLHFSADSKRLAYHARRGKRDLIVIHEGGKIREVGFKPKPKATKPEPEFSPGIPANVQIIARDEKQLVVWKGSEGRPYDEVAYPVLGPDARYLAYWGKRDNLWFIVVNGVEGKSYPDGPGSNPMQVWDPEGTTPEPTHRLERLEFINAQTLQTLALRADKNIVGVKIQIVEKQAAM